MKIKTLFVVLLSLSLPFLAAAKLGVGVGTGKIEIDQAMKAGLIYDLPSLIVLNTGDEASEYTIGIQHREKQPELVPEDSWFQFEPKTFYLEPGENQIVNIRLTLPVKGAKPGDYFAFLQAYPVQKATSGGTTIGVAAATKLYFTVAPANIFVGLYYRAASIFAMYSPWSYIIGFVILLAIIMTIFRKIFRFKLNLSIDKK